MYKIKIKENQYLAGHCKSPQGIEYNITLDESKAYVFESKEEAEEMAKQIDGQVVEIEVE